MKRLGQVICFCLLAFTFSCDTDEVFDNENTEAKVQGEWIVTSVESKSYSSTMTSPSGTMDTSMGSFTGTDIDMTLTFDADGTFSTAGDYNQVLTIDGPFPDPIVVESRFNDFAGGGTWAASDNTLSIKTNDDSAFQEADLAVSTDTEMEFDYSYTRTLVEGTITRLVAVDVTYVLEKQ